MLPPRAYVFIGLNAIRILSIIALLLVFSSSIVVMVHDIEAVNRFVAAGKVAADAVSGNSTVTDSMLDCDYIEGSTVPNQPAGVFWAVLNRLLIIGQTVVLIMSEVGWPSAFFNRFFPILGKDFGLGALGIIQCLIGAAVLSHHVDDFALVAAFFLFAIGCLNMVVGLIFRASGRAKRSITSWRDQAKSALPTHIGPVDVRPMMNNPPSFVSNVSAAFGGPMTEKQRDSDASGERNGMGFGRQGEKAAAMKGYLISKPLESLPRYATRPSATGASAQTELSSTPTAV